MPIISDIGFIANYVARKFSLRSTGKKDLKVWNKKCQEQ